MNDYYENGDPGLDGFEIFFGGMSLFMVGAMMFIIYAFCPNPKPSKGYGGSPGHMSPMEVEALYEKNKNNARP
jgi:hypothetical protein